MKFLSNIMRQLLDAYCLEFKLVIHDLGLILFLLFLPLAYPVIYSLIYNQELVRDVKMVVVDNDRSSRSRELVRNLDATQEAWVTGYAADMGEAHRAMDSHQCHAILEITEGFGEKTVRGEQADATLYCEASLLLRYRALLLAATNVSAEMGAEILLEKINEEIPLAGTIASGDVMPIGDITMGNVKSGFDSFIMPAIVILILHQCIILAFGMSGGAKRECPRLYMPAPATRRGVMVSMLGEMLCHITVLIVPTIFLVYFVPLIFAFPMEGNLFEILLFLVPMVIACMGVGFCIQGFVREREAIFIIWVATSVIFLFLSGVTWPRYAMDPVWKFLGALVPATWGMEGFIRMNTNGASLAQVGDCYLNLWLLAAVYLALGYCVKRWATGRIRQTPAKETA